MTVNHDVVGSSPTCGVGYAALAQSVECFHGKEEVVGSIPIGGLIREEERFINVG